jgi:hypothetical protein
MTMLQTSIRRSLAVGLIALPAVIAFTACSDEAPEEQEPEVATMRLTVGAQTITVSDAGVVTGGPVAVPDGGTVSLSAAFLKADGTVETLVTDADFVLNGAPANPGIVTFSRTSAFAATLTGVSAGTTTIQFSLFHTLEGHDDFGPFPVSVEVS